MGVEDRYTHIVEVDPGLLLDDIGICLVDFFTRHAGEVKVVDPANHVILVRVQDEKDVGLIQQEVPGVLSVEAEDWSGPVLM